VLSAKRRVNALVSSAARNEDYTHFVSLPLPGAAPGVQSFNASMLARATDVPGLDSSVFVSSKQLHITLVMLRLLDEDAVMNAAALFRGLAAKVRRTGKLSTT
jgi:hypothetical protein